MLALICQIAERHLVKYVYIDGRNTDQDLLAQLTFKNYSSEMQDELKGPGLRDVDADQTWFFRSPAYKSRGIDYVKGEVLPGKGENAKRRFEWLDGY